MYRAVNGWSKINRWGKASTVSIEQGHGSGLPGRHSTFQLPGRHPGDERAQLREDERCRFVRDEPGNATLCVVANNVGGHKRLAGMGVANQEGHMPWGDASHLPVEGVDAEVGSAIGLRFDDEPTLGVGEGSDVLQVRLRVEHGPTKRDVMVGQQLGHFLKLSGGQMPAPSAAVDLNHGCSCLGRGHGCPTPR